ncbi:hypothetical protein HNQ85_002518 [Anoxybacillus calidus]|uniref:Lipoprotein n=1 Tax=[Anoxybacillus] calidus TaxID=575178 RepID=A0A7V9Z192_9BACL|nr:hypothetical protein [Anoxybacillus calidus]MBA2872209.1 hypothetical protein [Anoxybacillus calidus]
MINRRIKKFLFALTTVMLLIVAGCSSGTEPPEAIVKINDDTIETSKGTYQWETQRLLSKKVRNADAAAPSEIAKKMKVKIVPQGSTANIEFSDNSEPELNVYSWKGEERTKELPLKQNQLTLPSQVGRYVIEIFARWSNGDASYTFVVEIQ